MKLKTMGIYGKAIKLWTAVASKTWLNFKKYFKSEYARIPKQGVDNTMAHEGYGLAYNAIEENDATTIASITKGLSINAGKQLATETSVTTLSEHTAFLAHQVAAQQHQMQALLQQGQAPPNQFGYCQQQPRRHIFHLTRQLPTLNL